MCWQVAEQPSEAVRTVLLAMVRVPPERVCSAQKLVFADGKTRKDESLLLLILFMLFVLWAGGWRNVFGTMQKVVSSHFHIFLWTR